MAMHELDDFAPKQFLGFIRSIPDPVTFRRQRYLPNQTVSDLSFEYILGANGPATVMAHVMSFDAEAPIGGRRAQGETVSGELPPIKRKVRVGEKELIRFYQPRANSNDMVDAIVNAYRDAGDLADSITARLEDLAFKALSEDTLEYNEGGLKFTFDFGVRDDFQFFFDTGKDDTGANVTGVTAGDLRDPDFDVLPWLRAICDRVGQRSGTRPTVWEVPGSFEGYLLANNTLRDLIRGPDAPQLSLTPGELDTIFLLHRLPRLEVNDVILTQENPDGTTFDRRAMAENRSFLTNGTPLGNTLFGPTAESRVLFGTPLAAAAAGVWAEMYGTTEPPAEWIKVAATAFPSIPGIKSLAQVRLWADDE